MCRIYSLFGAEQHKKGYSRIANDAGDFVFAPKIRKRRDGSYSQVTEF